MQTYIYIYIYICKGTHTRVFISKSRLCWSGLNFRFSTFRTHYCGCVPSVFVVSGIFFLLLARATPDLNCFCVCVCAACVCVCVCECVRLCAYLCKFTQAKTPADIIGQIASYNNSSLTGGMTYIYIYICMYIYLYAYVYIYMYIYICTYIYIGIQI